LWLAILIAEWHSFQFFKNSFGPIKPFGINGETRTRNEDKFAVIHSGIDLKEFTDCNVDRAAKRTELGITPGDFIVGSIGRLSEIKGYRYLIEAIPGITEIAPETRFIFVGDGPQRDQFKEMAAKQNVSDKVIFLGIRKDIAEIISIFDIFVLPS